MKSLPRNCANLLTLLGGILCSMNAAGQAVDADQFTNSLGMEFVRIPPGTFLRGQDEGGDWDEAPAHQVTISRPFHLAVTEVTNAQYEAFDPEHRAFRGKEGFAKDDDEAVVFVSWHNAVAFCAWLSEKEGKPYRLPTEAEWEYACRAGTNSPYWTGDRLPEVHHKHQEMFWYPVPVGLHVGMAPPNPWALYDMHGNVEEWCLDWYGPYDETPQTDPVGYATGDFRVTRGGSHSTVVTYLRSANRAGALPEDKHWLIGFRVVLGALPETAPLPSPAPALWGRDVQQTRHRWTDGPDPDTPYFEGPQRFVKIPPGSTGPLFSEHNHCPALCACPNGDLLAIWYTTVTEPGRELAIAASRLRNGASEWDDASPFWDAPDRNDHASALYWDGRDTLFHLNGISTDATWGKMALLLRTSTDNGATWSPARLVNPTHQLRNMPIAGIFSTNDGRLILPCDAVTIGEGGSAIHLSSDGGATWVDPGSGQPQPVFEAGRSGAWIAGIHAGVAELSDGRFLALGRGNNIDGRMPMSVSTDGGTTWTYQASPFPPLSGGQRLVLRRLQEGALLLVSFTDPSSAKNPRGLQFKRTDGQVVTGHGMFAAVSYDDGVTWPQQKLITPGKDAGTFDGGAWTREFTLDATHAEPKGYLASTQTPDGVIHLISSGLYYRFNLAWIEAPAGD